MTATTSERELQEKDWHPDYWKTQCQFHTGAIFCTDTLRLVDKLRRTPSRSNFFKFRERMQNLLELGNTGSRTERDCFIVRVGYSHDKCAKCGKPIGLPRVGEQVECECGIKIYRFEGDSHDWYFFDERWKHACIVIEKLYVKLKEQRFFSEQNRLMEGLGAIEEILSEEVYKSHEREIMNKNLPSFIELFNLCAEGLPVT